MHGGDDALPLYIYELQQQQTQNPETQPQQAMPAEPNVVMQEPET